ncbi:MAG: hypothetical protein PF693_01900 [Spirochaetia bacterium]|jgi:hypothetical protein|nr:hypothetical protein [Spirochaetia bacterium]
MKRQLFIFIPLLLLLFTGFFVSCDFLLPAPLGRNNPFDDEAQIGRFNVAVSGTDSMVTNWDWHTALSSISDERVIDKIRIVHREGSRPTGIGLLFDENVQEYTSTSEWSFNWTDLKNDEDHYFALYAHEKGGLWLAPRYADKYLDSFVNDNNYIFYSDNLDANNDPEEFKIYKVSETPFTITDVSNMSAPGFAIGDYAILEFKIDQPVFFDSFLLHLNNPVLGSDENLTIYSIEKDINQIFDWTALSSDNTLDYENSIDRLVTIIDGANQSIDISEIANRVSSLYYSRSIAIKVNDSFSVDVSLWTLDTHFWGNN